MSRSEYSDDCSNWEVICWRGAVASAIRGKRGQAFLRELIAALDAMPAKKLARGNLITPEGRCALGVVGHARGMQYLERIQEYERREIAAEFGIAESLAAEIMFENDEWWKWNESPQARYQRMREWASRHITQPSERNE